MKAMPSPKRETASSRKNRPRLYGELAEWFPLVTPSSDYAEEAAFYSCAGNRNSMVNRVWPDRIDHMDYYIGLNKLHVSARFAAIEQRYNWSRAGEASA